MNRVFAYASEAVSALLRNKTRAILTMLGIFIGVGAVDAVYAISTGAATAINASFGSGDQPALTIYPDGQQPDVSQAYLSYRDAELAAQVGGGAIRRVVPDYSIQFNRGRAYSVRAGDKSTHVVAYGYSWIGDDANMKTYAGRAFAEADVDDVAPVCMVTPNLAEKLFGSDAAAVDRYVVINGQRFRVVGVVNADAGTANQQFFGTFYFILPYTTFHEFDAGRIDALLVWIDAPSDEDAAKQAVLDMLQREHGVAAKYTVQSTREALQQQERVLNIIAVGLTAIGGISLFVAGIGIMNIMLVSVTERTREIGIRKSIGASRGDIVLQFLMEAVLLSLGGGALGLALALLIIVGSSGFFADRFGSFAVPYATVVLLAFAFSLVVGLAFGVYPAVRASRLDPVEALRS